MKNLTNSELKSQIAALDKMAAAWAEQEAQNVYDGLVHGQAAKVSSQARAMKIFIDAILFERECSAQEREAKR